MAQTDDKSESGELKTYEVGFLLSPLIAAEAVPEAVNRNFKEAIGAVAGEVVGESPVRSLALAYPIRKLVGTERLTFKEAFFGSLRFRVPPEEAVRLGENWLKQPEVIRYLLTEVSKADLSYEKRLRLQQKRASTEARAAEDGGEIEEKQEESKETSAAVIDREIDSLLSS